jgi:hypothetical protein
MKRIIGIGGGLLVVVAIAVFFLYSSLDGIITAAIEKFGSEITQTQVTLVVGSVVSGAKDMLEKGTAGTQDLVESSKGLVEDNLVGDAVKGLFGN